jgi:hypothetical protein
MTCGAHLSVAPNAGQFALLGVIIFRGGAEWLEGSFPSGLLFWYSAPEWSAEGMKLLAAGTWICQAIWFVLGLLMPGLRSYGL